MRHPSGDPMQRLVDRPGEGVSDDERAAMLVRGAFVPRAPTPSEVTRMAQALAAPPRRARLALRLAVAALVVLAGAATVKAYELARQAGWLGGIGSKEDVRDESSAEVKPRPKRLAVPRPPAGEANEATSAAESDPAPAPAPGGSGSAGAQEPAVPSEERGASRGSARPAAAEAAPAPPSRSSSKRLPDAAGRAVAPAFASPPQEAGRGSAPVPPAGRRDPSSGVAPSSLSGVAPSSRVLPPSSSASVAPLPLPSSVPSPSPIVPPSPPVAPSSPAVATPAPPVSDESLALDRAIGYLRRDHDAPRALAALDGYLARHPNGALRREAQLARIDALLMLGRTDQALAALESTALGAGLRSTELLVVRAELRAEKDCRLAERDFTSALARTPDERLLERILHGRGACRARLQDRVGATDDVRRYLERFPNGAHAEWARRWMASAAGGER